MVRKGPRHPGGGRRRRAEEARESEGKKPANIQLATPGIKEARLLRRRPAPSYENINEHNHYTGLHPDRPGTVPAPLRRRLLLFRQPQGRLRARIGQHQRLGQPDHGRDVQQIEHQRRQGLHPVPAGRLADRGGRKIRQSPGTPPPTWSTRSMRTPRAAPNCSATPSRSTRRTPSLTVGLNAVQYLYVNSNEATLGLNNNDVFIIGEQIPVTWKISKDFQVKVAPASPSTPAAATPTSTAAWPPAPPTPARARPRARPTACRASTYFATANCAIDPVFISSREADHLAIFSAPGEFNFNVAGIPFRPYWDFEYNTQGEGPHPERLPAAHRHRAAGGIGTGVTAAAASQTRS